MAGAKSWGSKMLKLRTSFFFLCCGTLGSDVTFKPMPFIKALGNTMKMKLFTLLFLALHSRNPICPFSNKPLSKCVHPQEKKFSFLSLDLMPAVVSAAITFFFSPSLYLWLIYRPYIFSPSSHNIRGHSLSMQNKQREKGNTMPQDKHCR